MKPHTHRYAGLPAFAPRNARRFGSIFNPPSPPPPAPPPPPPAPPPAPPPPILDEDQPEVIEARRQRRLAEARRRGRAATILTGGQGDQTPVTVNRPGLRSFLGGR